MFVLGMERGMSDGLSGLAHLTPPPALLQACIAAQFQGLMNLPIT